MANSYDINQINLLVIQKALKKHLKAEDSIFLDGEYLIDLEITLQNNNIEYEIFPMAKGYQVIVKKVVK